MEYIVINKQEKAIKELLLLWAHSYMGRRCSNIRAIKPIKLRDYFEAVDAPHYLERAV